MLEKIQDVWSFFVANSSDILIVGVIMVSAIIVFMGLLKGWLFSKIKNKAIKGTLLGVTSLSLSFIGTALSFWLKGISFDYYLYGAIPVAVATVFVYFVYEITGAKTGVHWLGKVFHNFVEKTGSNVLIKIFGTFGNAVKNGVDIVPEIKTVGLEIEKSTKTKLKEIPNLISKDDLENL